MEVMDPNIGTSATITTGDQRKAYGKYCAAIDCSNTSKTRPDFSFFRFPKDAERSKQWVQNCGREDLRDKATQYLNKNCFLCAQHFELDQFMNQTARNKLIWNGTPTAFDRGTLKRPLPLPATDTPKNVEPNKSQFNYEVQRGRAPNTKSELLTTTSTKASATTGKIKKIISDASQFLPEKALKFFEAQMHLFSKNIKARRRSDHMKELALSLYYLSPKAYKMSSAVFALPQPRILETWLHTFNVYPGLSHKLFNVLKSKVEKLEPYDRMCVLVFDKMAIKKEVVYDQDSDSIDGFADLGSIGRSNSLASDALVIMIKGLFRLWKQPVGYFLSGSDCREDELELLLKECLDKLMEIGLTVKVVLTDLGGCNRGLFRNLGVTEDKPWFKYKGKKIFCTFDPSHLFKSVRNNCIKDNIVVNGKVIKWEHIVAFYDVDRSRGDFRLAPNLTPKHLSVGRLYLKMRLSLARQVLDHSVAAGIYTYSALGILPPDAVYTAQFIDNMSKLFDCFSSNTLHHENPYKRGMSETSKHLDYLKEMASWFQLWDTVNKEKLACIMGWRMAINCLIQLWEEVAFHEGVSFLLTHRLSQDSLEDLFAIARQKGKCLDNPNANQFRGIFGNCMAEMLIKAPTTSNCPDDLEFFIFSVADLNEILKSQQTNETNDVVRKRQESKNEQVFQIPEVGENDATYVNGYLVAAALAQHNCTDCQQQLLQPCQDVITDTSQVSSNFVALTQKEGDLGNLHIPSANVTTLISQLDANFSAVFSKVCYMTDILDRVFRFGAANCDMEWFQPTSDECRKMMERFVKQFYKFRIFVALKVINKERIPEEESTKKKLKQA